jgi:hypothetical protein
VSYLLSSVSEPGEETKKKEKKTALLTSYHQTPEENRAESKLNGGTEEEHIE